MELEVLDSIALDIDVDRLGAELRIDSRGMNMMEPFGRVVEEARRIGRPKAAFRFASFEKAENSAVLIDGISLHSRVLSVHLEDVYRVFPFVVTCGRELGEWARTKTDMMERFWANSIMDRALMCAGAHLAEHLKQRYGLEKAGAMTPGSLIDWPIQEQIPLFGILGDIEGAIGVRLTEGLMMDPLHSASGILFPTEEGFEECSLCPRENCPKRRVPFEEHLYETRYGGTVG